MVKGWRRKGKEINDEYWWDEDEWCREEFYVKKE
jgi:hypothetical protein